MIKGYRPDESTFSQDRSDDSGYIIFEINKNGRQKGKVVQGESMQYLAFHVASHLSY